MAKLTVKAGSTSRIEHIFILDSASTTGAGKTLLTNSSVTAYYFRPGNTTATPISLTGTGSLGTFTSGLFKEVDATNMPGLYELDIPDAVFAAGANHAVVMVKGTGIAPVVLEYDLVAYDPLDTVRLGLTAMPNVASGSAGAIITSGTGTAQLSVSSGLVTLAGVTHTGAVIPTVSAVSGAVGSVTGAVTVGTINAGVITATSIATDAITAAKIATDADNEIADAVLSRSVSNVQGVGSVSGTANEHTLCSLVLANLENSISGTTLTVYKTDRSGAHLVKTLTTNASGIPITGID